MFIAQFSIIISLVFVLLMFIILLLQCTIRCVYTNKINNIENEIEIDEESVTNNVVLDEIFPNVRKVPYIPSVRNQTVSFQC